MVDVMFSFSLCAMTAFQIARSSSGEGNSDSEKAKPKNSSKTLSFTAEEREEQDAVVLAMATTAMFYFLQMSKILSTPVFRHSILTAMCHPLSQEARNVLLLQLIDGGENKIVPFSSSESVENPFKEALQYFLASDHQLAVLLIVYTYYTISTGWCEGDGSNDLQAQQAKLSLLESIGFIPPLGVVLPKTPINWAEVQLVTDSPEESTHPQATAEIPDEHWKRKRHVKKSISASNFTQEYLSAGMLNELTLVQDASGTESSQQHCSNDLTSFCQMLLSPHTYSLTALQVSVHMVVGIAKLLFSFAKHYNASAHLTADQDTFDGYGTFALQYLVSQVRLASRNAAAALLSRFDSHFSEMLLILVNEEIKRFQGRKWKVVFPRMVTEKLLMVPESPRQSLRLGIDFELPISQVEILRREVQHFLMMRALLKHLLKYNIYNSKDAEFDVFDLSTSISDRDLLGVDESNLVPDHLTIGNPYDMKGKKFLDTKLFSEEDEKNSQATAAAAAAAAAANQPTSNWFGFGGSKKLNPVAAIKSTNDKTSNKDKDKFLFVQDPNLLIIVLQKRIDGKSTFKIHAVASLLYADAKLDLTNKQKFTVMARSWKGLQNMSKMDLDNEDALDDGPASGFANKKFDSFLKLPERSSIYQITMSMDTEQASALAVQHIESRRKALTAIKMENFKTLLGKWSSESDIFEQE
jgi:hypothetical protein